MPGKNYIKVTSILLILSAIIAVIVYPIAGLFLSYATIDTGENLGWIIVVICLLYTIAAVLQLTAGIKGVKGCNNKKAAPDLKKWGKIVLIISLIAGVVNFINAILQQESIVIGVISILLSLAIPILYIHGASLNEE